MMISPEKVGFRESVSENNSCGDKTTYSSPEFENHRESIHHILLGV